MLRTFSDADIARFWKYVQKTDCCWLWTGAKLDGGHGAFQLNGKCIGAHVASFIIHFGAIADGFLVRHTCDNPPCVRPDHLLSGTVIDNVADRDERGRTARGEQSGMAKLTEIAVKAVRLDPREFGPIAKEHKITPAEVGHIKHKRIWKHVDGPIVFGNKRCKLTDEEILAIYRDPRSNTKIAESFEIGDNAVWYIKHRVTHKNVTEIKEMELQ